MLLDVLSIAATSAERISGRATSNTIREFSARIQEKSKTETTFLTTATIGVTALVAIVALVSSTTESHKRVVLVDDTNTNEDVICI